MKIADGFVLKKVADSYVVVPVGSNVVDFTAMITINETGEFIWQQLLEDTDIDTVVDAMCAEYEVDRATAAADVAEFVNILKDKKVLV